MKLSKNIIIKILLLSVFIQSFLFAASSDCPKNIIFIIVDGGGFNHLKAIDRYEKKSQPFEKFPVKLAVTTYPAGGSYDSEKAAQDFNYVKTGLITDSAAAATAMTTGIKTSNGSIGKDVNGNNIENIFEKCEKLGTSTGVVTTVAISHATPAGFAAHQKSRDDYKLIADELINQSGLDVLFGCGNPLFDDNGIKLDEPDFKYIDSKVWNSINGWTLIESRQEFLRLADGNTPKRVLGIGEVATTLQQKRGGNSAQPFDVPLNQNVPTLSEMTKAALNVLDDDPDGFFIMIEAGAVDWASHDNNGARVIEEMMDFTKAAETIIDWVEKKSSWRKTLLIITADHETGHLDIKNLPAIRFGSTKHTNSLVFFFAKGQGSGLFSKQVKGKDPVYGKYIDNTDIAKVLFSFLKEKS